MARRKVILHLAKMPVDDAEATFETIMKMFRSIAGKDPTPEDRAAARKTLGLPAKPPAKKKVRRKPKSVGTRKR